jgi:release factor glutamine methyltransferase
LIIRDLVLTARRRLAAAGVEAGEAALDAELLAREVLGWDRARFFTRESDEATGSVIDAFTALVARRERREPISAILGRREFWGLDFEVTRDVLTPRPETEIIVEQAIRCLAGGSAPAGPGDAARTAAGGRPAAKMADVGTGSGCLAVCLAREFPLARVVATDISAPALAVARRNAERHDVLDRIDFRLTSLLDGVSPPLDLVVSNPPYVAAGDIPSLPPEVREFEPREALDGGPDGLDAVRALMRGAAGVLRPGGWLIVEFGIDQEGGVRDAAERAGLEVVAVRADLQGIPRTVVARKPPPG